MIIVKMEAVPRLPMLCLELKPYPQKDVRIGPLLKNLIRMYYKEDPNNYEREIEVLEAIRSFCLMPRNNLTSLASLKRYFCQLNFLQKRFPMLKDWPVENDASWKKLLSTNSKKVLDFRLEYAITLYNIGALHTILGAADDRTTPEGLKLACTHFQCAAWAFQYLEEKNSMKYCTDFDPGLFQFLIPTCLAQAHECVAEKSIIDSRKPNTSATVAAQICEYYGQALNALTHGKQEELIFDVNIKNSHVWVHYVKYKKAYYECVSNLFLGMQAEKDEKMGERVAYFEVSAEKLKIAVQNAKPLEHTELYKGLDEAISLTRDIVEGRLKNAVNENEYIYHEKVPPKDNLSKVKGRVLVESIGFDFNDPEVSGRDIFSKLISLKAHHLSSIYSEEKAKLLRSVSASVEKKDAELVSYMQSLKLDYIHHQEDLNSLPEELVEQCAACEAKPDLIQYLEEAVEKLTQDQDQVEPLMKEVMQIIADEEKAAVDYHRVMGTSPTPSIVSTDLKCEANRYIEYLKKATDSNESLRNLISNLRILSLPLDELEQHLPKVAFNFSPEEEAVVRELKRLVDKVDEMRNQRDLLMMKLREALKNDDITEQIVLGDEDKNAFLNMVAKEIAKHQSLVNLIEQNLNAQDKILNALTNTYAAYAPIHKAIDEAKKQRDEQIKALIQSSKISDDAPERAAKGLDFFGKLKANARKLHSRLKGTVKVQEDNRIQQMYDKTKKARPTETTTSTPKLKDYIDYNKQFEKSDSTDVPLPYNPYYAPPSNYTPATVAPRSDLGRDVYASGSNQYYAAVSRPTVDSETNVLKRVNELGNAKNQPVPSATVASNYASYGYTYSQPQSYQPSTSYATSMNYGAPANTSSSPDVSNVAYSQPINYSSNTYTADTKTTYQSVQPYQPTVTNSYAAVQDPKLAYQSVQAYQPTVTSTYTVTQDPNTYQSVQAYQPTVTSAYTSTQDANTAYQSVQAYQATMNQATYANYTSNTSNTQQVVQNPSVPANNQIYSYANYNGAQNSAVMGTLPVSNSTNIPYVSNINRTPMYTGTTPNNYSVQASYNNTNADNFTSSTYSTGNYDQSQINSNVQNSQYNAYNPQYQYAGYTNYPTTYNNYNYPSVNATNPAVNTTTLGNYGNTTITFNTSHSYTNAGQSHTLNIESTSKTVDGRSYVMQYAAPNTNDPATNQLYYANQYGYQYKDPKTVEDAQKFAPKANDEGEHLIKQNSVTYMQAATSNNNTTSTYSMNGANVTSTEKKPESNIDLLADLDFQVSDTPLLPVPETNTTNQITEKMSNLSVVK